MIRPWFFLLLCAVPLVASAQDRSPALAPEKIAAIETQIEAEMKKSRIPGLTISIGLGNRLVYEKGFGYSDVENQVKATPATKFRTASIAKTMTAVLAWKLVEEGKLDLDKPVQAYYPAYPEKKWPVTSRHLLGHLGGVRHYSNDPFESTTTKYFPTIDAEIAYFANDELLHEPGSKYLYTTFGYNLLGGVVEKAGGAPFLTQLAEKICKPAGMEATIEDSHFAIIPHRSRGYAILSPQRAKLLGLSSIAPDSLINSELHDTSIKIPGGGLLSTSSDLVRFASAINRGDLLKPETVRQMWTEQKTTDGKPTGYGLGWGVGKLRGSPIASHAGGQSGASTYFVTAPEKGATVAIMCNLQGARLANLANDLLAQVAGLSAPPKAQDTTAIDYSDVIEKLRAAVKREVEQKDLPAFSISLVAGDKMIWAEGFGFEDKEKKRPATADTIYRVGSVSKLFTDIAVMQLAEKGKVHLDAPVQTYLPEFQPKNPFGGDITLRRLMSHLSGLVREPPVGHYFDPTDPTLAATVASLNQTSLVYPPGTRIKYSNAAIAVVGAVLEKQLDVSHPEQVEATILRPLGMTNSSFALTPKVKEHLATAYMRTYDGRRFEAPTFLLGAGPAGNMYSSVVDLGKFISCLFRNGKYEGGEILSEASLQEMLTPVLDQNGRPQNFGLGFMVRDLDGHRQIGHGGAVYGFSTQLEALPDRKIGVAAVAAIDGGNGLVSRLCRYALQLMLAKQDGKPLPEYRTTGPIAPERAKAIAGLFQVENSPRWARISRDNENVFLRNGVYEYALRAADDDGTLIVDDVLSFGAVVAPQRDGKLLIGRDSLFRVDESKPPLPPKEHWKGLIGEYGWDHNVLYILEDRGQLYALIEWFDYYPLTEIDENTYAFPDYGLYHGEKLIFSRNAQGEATHVVAAEVKFDRREVGTKHGVTFRVKPVRPIAELREIALAAKPPEEAGDFLPSDLVEITSLDPTIRLDIRYAGDNNFLGTAFYKEGRAFLQRPAAEAVVRAHQKLKAKGYGLLIHDAYRPWHVTKMFWDATPSDMHDFVANPALGSRHNRGCAVDLTLYDLATGKPVEMVGGYDEFSPRSFPRYPGGTSRERWHRELLREAMEAEGFTVYEFEWWHFDYRDWKRYPIGNTPFESFPRQ